MAVSTGMHGKLYRISAMDEAQGIAVPTSSAAANVYRREGFSELPFTLVVNTDSSDLAYIVDLDNTTPAESCIVTLVVSQADSETLRRAHFNFILGETGDLEFPGRDPITISARMSAFETDISFLDLFGANGYYPVSSNVDKVGIHAERESDAVVTFTPLSNEYTWTFALRIKVVSARSIKEGSWYRVLNKKESDSALHADLPVQGIMYTETELFLAGVSEEDADKVEVLSLDLVGSVKDISVDSRREKKEVTTLAQAHSSYVLGNTVEHAGSVNGFFDPDDPLVQTLLYCFHDVFEEDEENHIQRKTLQPRDRVLHFMLSRNRDEDEKRIWHYMPMIVDSFDAGKPMRGVQEVSFSYALDGKFCPHSIILE